MLVLKGSSDDARGMSRYSSPFAPTDRDSARLADELRAVAQDDTRRTSRAAHTPRRAHVVLRLRHALTLRAPKAH